MPHLRTRYALQRTDGHWFTNPTTSDTEWCPDLNVAHLWVEFQACVDAAYTHNKQHEGQLRSKRVWVRELLITADGERLQVQGVR